MKENDLKFGEMLNIFSDFIVENESTRIMSETKLKLYRQINELCKPVLQDYYTLL